MTGRKVFDIIPPKEAKEFKESVPLTKPQKRPDFTPPTAGQDEKPKPRSKKILFEGKKILWWPVMTILAIVGIAGLSFFLIKPKAAVAIWPVKSPLEVKFQIIVGSDIVGEEKTYECPFSQEFPATGLSSVNTKATGAIRVYNSYATSPQTLIATTRFVSDGGKLFRTPQKIVIPGAHYEGGKLIPGEVEAMVEAGEPGEDYNIGPSTFSLPALAGTPRYTAFYAKSFEPMKGGSQDEKSQVTKADLDNAQKTMAAAALENCKKSLENSLLPEEYAVLPEALESVIIESNALAKEGQEAEKFTFQVKTKTTALVFKNQALRDFAKTYILGQVPPGKALNESALAVSQALKSVDLDKGKITLEVAILSEIYPVIDENGVKEAVKNRNLGEISAALRQFPEIEKFQARLWPFWVSKAPADANAIAIELKLD